MAFVQVETWSPDPFQRIGAPAKPQATEPWSKLLANGRDAKVRRTMALVLSFAIHLGLIWLILDKLTTGIGEGEGQGHGDGITMIDLSGPKSADTAPSPAEVAAPQLMPTQVTSPVEASAPSDTFKPEWTVSKLRIATAQQVNAAPTPPAVAGSVNGQAGSVGKSAGGGGQGYDPYAGTSPQRRDPNVAVASGDAQQAPGLGERVMGWLGFGGGSDAPALNQRAFEEATQAIRRALPGVRGRLEISVRISAEGAVLEAQMRNTGLATQDSMRVQSILVGRKLFEARSNAKDTLWVKLTTMYLI